MSLFYKDSVLHLGTSAKSLNLFDVIKQQEGHACYAYDLPEIVERFRFLQQNLFDPRRLQIHYAVKANANPQILKALKAEGAQVDVVSGGEFAAAMDAGFKGEQVIFSGVGKTTEEIHYALNNNVQQINVESVQELQRIAEIATQLGKTAPIAFRMNPDVNPVTHPYITTGLSENKFGLTKEFLPVLLKVIRKYPKNLKLRGLTMHIGSQILQLEVFQEAIEKLLRIYRELVKQGFALETLDIGGGVGIQYSDANVAKDFEAIAKYAAIVQKTLSDFPGKLLIEPGRILVARSGVLLCKVEYIKESSTKNFAIVNSGMHHLLRPALYQASHRIIPVVEKAKGRSKMYDVVGPICESSDFLGRDRVFKDLQQGDYLAVCDAGAYGFAMASQYNAHGLPQEIILS